MASECAAWSAACTTRRKTFERVAGGNFASGRDERRGQKASERFPAEAIWAAKRLGTMPNA